MKHYQYRTELTDEERNDPFIAAAFEVAKHAHKQQSRYKKDKTTPYITHPLMVVDILYRMGIMDSRVIAAAILHDTLEDYSAYKNTAEQDAAPEGSMRKNHDRMHQDLLRALDKIVAKGWLSNGAAEEGAAIIFGLTKQVTKPIVYDENDKLQAQIDKITDASIEGKIIKIADQAASLIDRLVAPDDNNKFPQSKQVFTRKKNVNLVGYIIASARDDAEQNALKPWERFFHNVEEITTKFDEGSKFVRKHMFETADFDDYFKQPGKKFTPLRKKVEVVLKHSIEPVAMGNMLSPLMQVHVTSEMNVTEFVLRRGSSPDDPVYDVRRRLIDKEISETNRLAHNLYNPWKAEVGGIVHLLSGGQMVEGRLYTISPGMPLSAFMGTASRAQACTWEQDHEVQMDVTKILDRPSTPLGMDDLWIAQVKDNHGSTRGRGIAS